MDLGDLIDRVFQREAVNFVVTNRIPRRLATRFVGWFSRIDQPMIRDLSIAIWTLFAGDLGLHEAKKSRFTSLHDCFVPELREGARPVDCDSAVLVSPCDGIVGASGKIRNGQLFQTKGRSYPLDELLGGTREAAELFRSGRYVTLRLWHTHRPDGVLTRDPMRVDPSRAPDPRDAPRHKCSSGAPSSRRSPNAVAIPRHSSSGMTNW